MYQSLGRTIFFEGTLWKYHLPACLPSFLPDCLSVCSLSIFLSVFLLVCLLLLLLTCLCICLSVNHFTQNCFIQVFSWVFSSFCMIFKRWLKLFSLFILVLHIKVLNIKFLSLIWLEKDTIQERCILLLMKLMLLTKY